LVLLLLLPPYLRCMLALLRAPCSYGGLVLAIEVISSTATLGYAVLLIKHSRSRRTKGLPIGKKGAPPPDPEHLQFHVRVLIPCYKESTELVKETVLGALKAPLPKDTLCMVYLCDDGKDPTKAAMVRELNKEWGCLEYVSGRTRDPNGACSDRRVVTAVQHALQYCHTIKGRPKLCVVPALASRRRSTYAASSCEGQLPQHVMPASAECCLMHVYAHRRDQRQV
jgi:cellulose synthase/poly-beta-1,6-N-acetylglucosamine synthase-like glycosyltransferase